MMTDRKRQQSGQALVIMTGVMVALVALGALVFDAAITMSDRRVVQATADAASLAGARSFSSSSNQSNAANWTAMEYLATPLSFSLPTGGCASSSNCPAGSYTAGTYTITLADTTLSGQSYPTALDVTLKHSLPSVFSRLFGVTTTTSAAASRSVLPGPGVSSVPYTLESLSGDATIHGGGAGVQTVSGAVYSAGNFGANNNPHSTGVSTVQEDYSGSACPGGPQNHIDVGGASNNGNWNAVGSGSVQQNFNVSSPANYDNNAPTTSGPTYTAPIQAQILGIWQPGIYNGFAPSGGTMAGGVYKIINTHNPSFGTITNAIYTGAGTVDLLGAVAIVLDSSDTGSVDLSGATLTGLDDINNVGVRDPLKTHNFLLYGGNGASGFTGGMTMGPQSSATLSGILYMPEASFTSDGKANFTLIGSAIFSSFTVNGGGNGSQVFDWVCGLSVVSGSASNGGLVR